MENKRVGIIMGSDSDFEIMKEAGVELKKFGIEYEMTIVSAHRTPERAIEYAKSAEEKGISIIIAGAGGAAHLPGVIAAFTTLPVIGVPILTKSLSGMDSLFSIVQMPKGVPVATVAINGAANAGILAAQIIGIEDPQVKKSLKEFKEKMKKDVEEKAKNIEKMN